MGDPPPHLISRSTDVSEVFLSAGVLQNFPVEGCRGGTATVACGDQIGGLFCPRGRARVCVKPRSPELATLFGPGRTSFV